MRKATKTIISFAVVLIAGLNLIVPAFAQDPFTAIAIGGLDGLSGAGLFSSMASGSGVNIGWNNNTVDQMDAMWNVLNPDHVYFSGEKHEASMVGEDVYDYIDVDIGDWLEAQVDFISNFCEEYEVTDNDTGTLSTPVSCVGVPLENIGGVYYSGNIGYFNSMGNVWSLGPFSIVVTPNGATSCQIALYINGSLNRNSYQSLEALTSGFYIYLYQEANLSRPTHLLVKSSDTQDQTGKIIDGQADSIKAKAGSSANWTSGEVNTSVYDGWESARVKIPRSVSGLSDLWTIPDFVDAINNLWTNQQQGQIIIEDTDHPVPPPQPIPDTPLGDVPFDDWVDLWGQSIWEQLTRLEEKQELMVIGQEDGLESLEDLQGIGHDLIDDVDDLIGLETDINENLEDMITYEQGISEDVESIDENVQDVEDEVIVIVDEMGNVIDVLEGIDAKLYTQGQKLGEISTEVGTVASTTEAISTEVETQTETQAEIKEAVEDMVPYVAPLPDIATDTETMVDILPDIATATQTSTQTLTDTLPDIKDATQTMTDTLPDIITEIQDATTTITDDIPNIDDICENIDEAPYKDLDNGLDRLPRFMLPFIIDLRSALGIWHYVTEWLAQISTTFAFISGCLVGTSIMTPIYAAIAGFMCIKIYRRMTA